MVNQGARRVTVADLRRRMGAMEAELAACKDTERKLRDELAAKTPKGWRSWRWVGQLPAILTALAAVAALFYTAQGLSQTEASTVRQNELAESGQITDRFNTAVTNLGSDVMTIRLGGIYALQRIMTDSAPDQQTVIQVLAAFIRDQPPVQNSSTAGPAIDVQAALGVVALRNPDQDTVGTTFGDPDLVGVNLAGAQLAGAHLPFAFLSSADFSGANLSRVMLMSAILSRAIFTNANLTSADLDGADLTSAYLSGANLSDADLDGANLTNANLSGTKLRGVNLINANLDGANLSGTVLCDGAKPIEADRNYKCSSS